MVDIEIWRDTKIVKKLNASVVFLTAKNNWARRLIDEEKEHADLHFYWYSERCVKILLRSNAGEKQQFLNDLRMYKCYLTHIIANK